MIITLIRWLLLPISLIYWFIVWARNTLYDKAILKGTKFSIPTIVIGNLAIGGTGKSPMTEYIIRLLKDDYRIATLSRGYGRKTKGYKLVHSDSLAIEVGDEPLQFKNKFPEITVAVSENRCYGVQQLNKDHDLIILDDAYQHRKLTPGFTILLFDFNSLLSPIIPLPTGNFRDNFSATKRADLILITKCPDDILSEDRNRIEHQIRKHALAPIFYTGIDYGQPKDRNNQHLTASLKNLDIVLFCGIANPLPLQSYLTDLGNVVHILQYPDHHNYTDKDFDKIADYYQSLPTTNKIIITTEKDMQRVPNSALQDIPLYYIPITLKSMDKQQDTFDHFIFNYIQSATSVN
ncbi:tetraacyldisaccharide 4'-kinase [Sphingobacterium tabacisoli]|uniref:Tetraacyldisaccharide 4'-kinase n=1 Tax=Sphingobacterium tabacisoli TaxID=2044855 RepID=A0ABW5KYP3_9SPHI|nr:tetraacyldisaccharide 4'-kinase [Sphingobacterium tabacisoli]